MILIRQQIGQVAGRIRGRFRSRVLEWEHATIMTLWGAIVLCNPEVFSGPSFVAFWGGPWLWGGLFLAGGALRIIALAINGYMARPTALVRAVAALSGILLFSAIGLGLLFAWTWGPGLAVYPVLGVFSLFSLYWAIFDVAIPDHHDA